MRRKYEGYGGLAEPVATRVWFDVTSEQLYVEIDGMVTSIDFQRIPGEDFESSSPVVKFTLGYEGTVVICQHRDGAETWLPVDILRLGRICDFLNWNKSQILPEQSICGNQAALHL